MARRRKAGVLQKRKGGSYGGTRRVLESLGRRAWWRESDEQLEEKRNGKRAAGAGEGRWCLKEEILPKGFFRRGDPFSAGGKPDWTGSKRAKRPCC